MNDLCTLPPSPRRRHLLACLAAPLLAPPARAAVDPAPGWPSQALKMVVPFAAGGGADLVARAIGQHLAPLLGQPVVVENRPGGATLIGAQAVARATDQHTVLLSGSSTYTVVPALRPAMPYAAKDLAPVGLVAQAPLVLLVPATGPARTLAELVAQGKARPGELNYATFGTGSAPHLAGALLSLAAGVKLQDIPYKGSAPALQALVGGELQLGIDTVAAAAPLVRAGKLRALAVLGTARSRSLPEVPSVVEAGLSDAVFEAWYALAAPASLPAGARQKLGAALANVLALPALQAQLRGQAMEPSPADAARTQQRIDQELARYRALGHRAGIRME